MAQGTFKVAFSTPSSFYAGGAKLPPGTYTIRRSQDEQNLFTIQNSAGTHTGFRMRSRDCRESVDIGKSVSA
jgi:hypothetical protein